MKNFIFNKISVFRKSLLLTFILLFAFSCEQQDESADINAEQANTEVRARQMQVKAREIVNSEEYRNFVDQNELFLSKIHSGDFFSATNKRLSITSFEPAEDFIKRHEKIAYNTQALLKKYPELKNSLELREKVSEEFLKKKINEMNKRNKGNLRYSNPCGYDCSNDKGVL